VKVEDIYGIKVQLLGPDFKSELRRLVDEQGIKAVIMGNRKTDPYSSDLRPIEKSSPGWPEFIRIFPIINWDYHTVWLFLKSFGLPYCRLYDSGYTSLGEKHNTQLNPSLLTEEGTYKAACELVDESMERLSRC